jgi:hypothetical protein
MQTNIATAVTMSPYSVTAFNALPEFDVSKQRFAGQLHILDMFGEIVRGHHVEKYLGAALIHKHFSLHATERIIEEVKPEGSLITPRDGVNEDSVTPYLWHLSVVNSLARWTPVEFVISDTIPISVRDFAGNLSCKQVLLSELAALLINNDAQDTFGLALLHRQGVQFNRKTQVLLEAPGPINRSLKVTPVSPSVTTGDDWTQTYWHFDVDAKGVVNGCSQHGCAGYCSLHG